MKSCNECKFYLFHSKNEAMDDIGLCRRSHPKLLEENKSSFPLTHGKSWCGEFKRKGWFGK